MNLFIERLKELIIESGKMQKEICADLGVTKQKLSKWKTGYNEPSIDEIIMIAKYFKVTTDYLLGVDEDVSSKNIINNSFNNFTNKGSIKINQK